MSQLSADTQAKPDIMRFVKANIRDYALLLSLLAIMVFFQFTTNGTLFKPVNMTNLILQNSYIIIMALGMLLIIVAGHIDLSVGSVSGFIGAVAAILMVNYKVDIFTSVLICLALGGVIGGIQGYFTAYYKIPAFIVTLAGMLIFKGLALTVLGGASVGPFPKNFQLLSSGFVPDIFNGSLGGQPFNILALVIGAATTALIVYFNFKERSQPDGAWIGRRAGPDLLRPQHFDCRRLSWLLVPDGALQGPAERLDRHVRADCPVCVLDYEHHVWPAHLCAWRQ